MRKVFLFQNVQILHPRSTASLTKVMTKRIPSPGYPCTLHDQLSCVFFLVSLWRAFFFLPVEGVSVGMEKASSAEL